MERDEKQELVRRLAVAINYIDEVYCTDMNNIGFRPSEMWLLYALNDGEPHSQKSICEQWGFPRTTLNTAIKQAEAKGYLTLSHIPGKRREMDVKLTEKGRARAEEILTPICQAETETMERTIDRFGAGFVDAVEYFGQCLREVFAGKVKEIERKDEV